MTDDPNAPAAAAAVPLFRYTVCSVGGINIECQSQLDWISFVKNAMADGFVMGDKVFQPYAMITAIFRQDSVAAMGGAFHASTPNTQIGGANVFPFPPPRPPGAA